MHEVRCFTCGTHVQRVRASPPFAAVPRAPPERGAAGPNGGGAAPQHCLTARAAGRDGRRRGAQVIKLSDAVQALPRQVTCCVHGAAPGFVTAGAAKARSAGEGAGRRFSKGAYCLAKVVWGKGWEELLELMEYQGRVAAARGEVRSLCPALFVRAPVIRALQHWRRSPVCLQQAACIPLVETSCRGAVRHLVVRLFAVPATTKIACKQKQKTLVMCWRLRRTPGACV